MKNYSETGRPGKDELLFLPLGGSNEIGMNANIYGHDGKWLIVDLGIGFTSEYYPGTDIMMPDMEFIEQRKKDLVGIVVTHAHEDHIGAIAHLWVDLQCPIYASPFTARMITHKLKEAGLLGDVQLNVIPMGAEYNVGPFGLKFYVLTHSIPEPNALIISTRCGRVFHTGDWKFDPDPLIGDPVDDEDLKAALGGEILALVGDSTNVFEPGTSQSEAVVQANLLERFKQVKGRLAVGCFASNVARVGSILSSADVIGRKVCLLGKSLGRIWEVSRACGYLDGLDHVLVSREEAKTMPRHKILYLCTGSQGEPRAALKRLSDNSHPDAKLEAGDSVLFSSRVIPGNENKVALTQNAFIRNGIEVISDSQYTIHASGHPNHDELVRMFELSKPRIAIPVHGEARHIDQHAKLAESLQVPFVVRGQNGDMYSLHHDGAELVDQVVWGYLVMDGNQLIDAKHESIRQRRKIGHEGICFISVALDDNGLVGEIDLHLQGLSLFEDEKRLHKAIEDAVRGKIDENDKVLSEAIRVSARRIIRNITGHNPPVLVAAHRV